MKQLFKTGDLKTELERALGFRMVEFARLKCVNSINFKAVREGDGLAFTVKCIEPRRKFGYDLIVRHLRELEGSLAPQRVFEKECPASFCGYGLICLKWIVGGPVWPDRLSETEMDAFLDDYLEFSVALQRTTHHIQPYPAAKWRMDALVRCAEGWGRMIRPFVEECGPEESFFRPERLRVMHGDLHPKNFAFQGGRVSGFFDVEGLTLGYPAWDILRYLTFSIDHLPLYERFRTKRILARFAQAVRKMPYPPEEWIVAINVTWLEQVYKKLCTRRVSLLQALQLRLHARLFRRLRRIVAASAGLPRE